MPFVFLFPGPCWAVMKIVFSPKHKTIVQSPSVFTDVLINVPGMSHWPRPRLGSLVRSHQCLFWVTMILDWGGSPVWQWPEARRLHPGGLWLDYKTLIFPLLLEITGSFLTPTQISGSKFFLFDWPQEPCMWLPLEDFWVPHQDTDLWAYKETL